MVAGTYSEASRNTSTVGGKAGLGKSIDIVGGEICDDLELEFGGKREPARHCSLCQSPTAFYSVSKKTYLVCCCLSGAVHTPYSPHLGGRKSCSLGQFRSRLGGLITLPSPPLLPYPSISGASCPDTLGGSVQPLYDLLILSHAVVGLLGILSGASPRSEDLEQKTLLSVNNCILSCQ